MRLFFTSLVKVLYRFRAYNAPDPKTPGPLLLIPNHTSWIDWLFLYVALDDDWRFVTSSTTAQMSWLHRIIMLNSRTFPVDPASPYAVKRMAEFLEKGGKLVLFAEGRISLTGTLGKIFDGTGFLLSKTKARAVCGYVRGAYRLPLSPNSDKKVWFPRVSAHFSEILTPPAFETLNAEERRASLSAWLRDRLIDQQFETEQAFSPRNVWSAIVETGCKRPNHVLLEDTTGQTLTYRQLFIGTRVLTGLWRPLLFGGTSPIGLLLPNVNSAIVAFLGLWSERRIPAPLNYSSGMAAMLSCIQLAGIQQIITSRAFMARVRLEPNDFTSAGVTLIYLEDLSKQVSWGSRIFSAVMTTLRPTLALGTLHDPDETSLILFTSGSEGVPKAVALTHSNLMSNIHQMLVVNDFQDNDRLFNCLPMFHSFSLTVGTLLPLVRGIFLYLYPSPLHYRVIPAMFYDKNCTILLGTNTFLNGYARRAHPYDFRSLRYLFAGAEKIQDATYDLWARRFGVRILQAYGSTECGPALAANTPLAPKHGSVGRFLPHIAYRLETVKGIQEGGQLFVRGPNIMKGYLNPEANAAFQALGGWYDTGDIVTVDTQGFIEIKGRVKRFAKISGEMVSLTAVEEALAGVLPQATHTQMAVIAKPDPEKGETLVVVTNDARVKLDDLRRLIQSRGLTNLHMPEEIKVVPEIPKLVTGKTDYRALQQAISEPTPATS